MKACHKLRDICSALMKYYGIFRGSRDEWGAGSENAYEFLEFLIGAFPEEIIEYDGVFTVGKLNDFLTARFPSSCKYYREGTEYLKTQFGDTVVFTTYNESE